jgi:hypothetical protein
VKVPATFNWRREMANYSKLGQISAVQWNELGDHPAVVNIPPGVPSNAFPADVDVSTSGAIIKDQKYQVVNKGDYVIDNSDGTYTIMNKEEFDQNFKLIEPALDDNPRSAPKDDHNKKPIETTKKK